MPLSTNSNAFWSPKKLVSKWLGRSFQLFEDVAGEITTKDDDIITFLTDGYPGACKEEPMAVVYSKPKETKSQPKTPVLPEKKIGLPLKFSKKEVGGGVLRRNIQYSELV